MSCPSSFILYKTSRFPLKKTQICKRLLILELVQSSSRRICDLQRKALYFDNRVSDYRNRAKSGKSFSSIGCRHQFQGCCNCAVEETLMVHCQVIEDFNMVLEDQNGKKVQMGLETDLRAIMISLMLHTNAKQLIKAQNYQDALEVPSMGEEAFSLCDQKVIEWQEFALRKPEKVLNELMEGLFSRVRLLQIFETGAAGTVVAYHSGQVDKSMKVLTSVQDSPRKSKRQRQAVDASVEALVRMGFDRSLAVEALPGGGTMDQTICRLLSGQAPNLTNAANQSEAIPAVDANNNSQSDVATDIANSLASMLDNQNGQVGGPSTSSNASERDAEMESQLAEELAQGDAFTDYESMTLKFLEKVKP